MLFRGFLTPVILSSLSADVRSGSTETDLRSPVQVPEAAGSESEQVNR